MSGVGSYIGGMIVLLAGAIGCPIIAYKKYRNVVGWLVLGFFGGLISLIVIACLPSRNHITLSEQLKVAEEIKRNQDDEEDDEE